MLPSGLRPTVIALVVTCVALTPPVIADEAPIAGTVKSVDTAAGTFLVESTSKGKVREVVIHMRSDSRIVRFTRAPDGGKPGFSEQAATLADLRPGWIVSVKTKHEAQKEVAETVRVVHER
jgi:hypothetical protein